MRQIYNYLLVLGAVTLLTTGCARQPMRGAEGRLEGEVSAEDLRVRDSLERVDAQQLSERERADRERALHRTDSVRRADSTTRAQALHTADSLRFGRRVAEEARRHLGARYAYGKTGPKAFDCSGFTLYVFRACGVRLDHSSRAQYRQGCAVKSRKELRIGDLVFFGG